MILFSLKLIIIYIHVKIYINVDSYDQKTFRDRSRKGKYLLAKKIKLRSENENVNAKNQSENMKTLEQNLTR